MVQISPKAIRIQTMPQTELAIKIIDRIDGQQRVGVRETKLTHRTNDVGYVRDASAGSSSEVQNFCSRRDVNFVDTAKNSRGQLRP